MPRVHPKAEHSIEAQIAAVVREIAFRERVYPRWVKAQKLTEEAAAFQIDVLRAVLVTLEDVKGKS